MTVELTDKDGMVPSDPTDWIDDLTDSQCMEIFWLYVDPPEPFLEAHPPELLGLAMRQALREVAAWEAQQSGESV